jgi:hypothetical protein
MNSYISESKKNTLNQVSSVLLYQDSSFSALILKAVPQTYFNTTSKYKCEYAFSGIEAPLYKEPYLLSFFAFSEMMSWN